jgi:hypothetical protein
VTEFRGVVLQRGSTLFEVRLDFRRNLDRRRLFVTLCLVLPARWVASRDHAIRSVNKRLHVHHEVCSIDQGNFSPLAGHLFSECYRRRHGELLDSSSNLFAPAHHPPNLASTRSKP